MKLIVGLGNPGPKYLMTRHNIGFMAVDHFCNTFQSSNFKKEHKAETCQLRVGAYKVLLAKPQTYMNLSGESVQKIMKFYQIAPQDLLVIHDEIELPFSSIRYQFSRGHGGHNGIRNIHQMLSTKDYYRLRLGVGRPKNPNLEVSNYVLQNFNSQEEDLLPDFLEQVTRSLETYIELGFEKAANQFNQVAKEIS